ncbi:MAG: aminodeoxychorismate/anthranilate synthase component II [Bacteroidales bacterium]|nr:aminodeoxychorismate/anthranilate synthase component II [Bacteroidales bacterium]
MFAEINILIIDNFDSFTYNLVHYFEPLVNKVNIKRTDVVSLLDVENADAIVISPGPGLPSDYPILKEIILNYAAQKPIFGVCLGQQVIAEALGGKLFNLKEVWHGIARETIVVQDDILFYDIPKQFKSARYHSWVVDEQMLPDELLITSRDVDGFIMSLSHKVYPLKSVQFHPESVLTPYGKKIIKNWVTWLKEIKIR